MNLFTTSIRLIKASITGAIGGAKDAVILEKQFMAWESELEVMEIFDGYQGWIEVEDDDIPAECANCIVCDKLFIGELDTCSICHSQLDVLSNKIIDHSEDGNTEKANQLNDLYVSLTNGLFIEPVSYQRDCISCDNLYGTPTHGMLMCDHCLSQDDQIDELPDFLKEHKRSEYHMDTCCIEATGVCNCDLPF